MSCADEILDICIENGVRLISGVPCSSLGRLIDAADRRQGFAYIPAANEGDAVAVATGAWLGGGMPGVVVCQNSGLGNAVSPLTSLVSTVSAPFLAFVGWRGGPNTPDEPQHDLMGRITPALLELCDVEVLEIGGSEGAILGATRSAFERVMQGRRVAILIENNVLSGSGGDRATPSVPGSLQTLDVRVFGDRPARVAVLRELVDSAPADTALISTTGKTSRELFTISDRAPQFYQVGAMGCVGALALGVTQATARRVVAIDGDGAALMRLGALSTIGAMAPTNLVHLLLDNERHDSTGGQRTTSNTTDLADVALACGYRRVARCDLIDGVRAALRWAWEASGPAMVHVKIAGGSMEPLGRPNMAPATYARRFREFMMGRA